MTLVEFECQSQRFALPLGHVKRVVHSALPSALPGTPEHVLGILNVAGEIVIVIDFCRRVGLPSSAICPSQRLLVAEMSGLRVGLVVDRVCGVIAPDPACASDVPERLAAADFIEAFVRFDDGLCVIVDPEKFLLSEETAVLVAALETMHHENQ